MKKGSEPPELQYIQTGLLTGLLGLLLHLKRVDLVVGGCGTGQGYLNSAMQYPGVCCGHILTTLDAWLFAQINDGNCVSLMLNQGYGWAGDVNLRMILDAYFSVERGRGYPPRRQAPQRASRMALWRVTEATHRSWPEILAALPDEYIGPALSYPGFWELLDMAAIQEAALKSELLARARPGLPEVRSGGGGCEDAVCLRGSRARIRAHYTARWGSATTTSRNR